MGNGLIRKEDLHDTLAYPQYAVPVTTNQEINSTNVDSNKVVNVDIQGKTVVNLLGSDGDCEDVNIFLQYQATRSLDNTNKVFGNNGLKVTLSTGYTTGSVNPGIRDILDINKYYCVSVYVKNGNATEASLKVDNGYSGLVNITNITDTTKFNRLFMKLNPTQHSNTIRIILQVSGIESQYAYFDGIMVEEITQAEYNDANFVPSEYVNSDMSAGETDTKVKTIGKNAFNMKNIAPLSTQFCSIVIDNNTLIAKEHTEAGGGVFFAETRIPVRKNTTYTFSYNVDVINNLAVYIYDGGSGVGSALARGIGIGSVADNVKVCTFATLDSGYIYIGFNFTSGHPLGTNIISNIQLEEGLTATTYEPYKETCLDVPVLRSLPNGVKDEIVDNELIKRLEKVVLEGSFGWLFGASITGAKRVYLPNDAIPNSISLGDGQLIKYNGVIAKNTKSDGASADTFYLANNSIRVYISSADSGWGDNYTPTVDEIKAYFYGWRMFTAESPFGLYNGTGTKRWGKIYCGVGTSYTVPDNFLIVNNEYSSTVPTTLNDRGYTPYRLYYQLATPIITDIIKPNLVAYPSGTLQIESTSDKWVIPNVTYTICDSEKANIDEVMESTYGNKKEIIALQNLSNPNLLINGDFQVWQRGESFTNAAAASTNYYNADRWTVASYNDILTVNKIIDGIKLSRTTTNSSLMYLSQTIEVPSYLWDKEVTFSYEGDLIQSSLHFNKTIRNGLRGADNGYTETNSISRVIITKIPKYTASLSVNLFATGTSMYIKCAKLELGSKATPLSPRPYAEELAMCQRYYRNLIISANGGKTLNQYDGVLIYNLDRPMRISPTIKFYNVLGTIENAISDGNSADITGTFLALTQPNNYITISYRDVPVKTLVTNTTQCLLRLDAEIY